MPRTNVYCDQCRKYIGDDKLARFSNAEKNIDFCSEECYSEWKEWIEVLEKDFKLGGFNELKKWKSFNFTVQEAKRWIKRDFSPEEANNWKNQDFTPQQAREWTKIGLSSREKDFINYLKQGNYQSSQLSFDDLIQLKKEYYHNYSTAQEWLDRNYPLEKRSKAREIYLNEPSLEGELDLGDFKGGVHVLISPSVDEHKLTFINKPKEKLPLMNEPKEVEFTKLVHAQEHMEKNYPSLKEKRKELVFWYFFNPLLEGVLNLHDFVNLKKVTIAGSKLTSLNTNNCSRLEKIDCQDNLLTNLNLPTNPTTLKYLGLKNNNFPSQDLSFLTPYINLEELYLSNNKFTGSLDCLSGMEKLKKLWIYNTDIEEIDTDKLPKSLEDFCYSIEFSSDCKLNEIIPQLDVWAWKDFHSEFGGRYGELLRRGWEKEGFSKEQTQEWIQVGLKPKDYNFASWLRSSENLTPQEFSSKKDRKDYQEARKICNDFDWCRECRHPNTSKKTCHPCSEKEWKKLSDQELINKFIENQTTRKKLEWIPYEKFSKVEYLKKGGFGTIYKAYWGEWSEEKWNDKKGENEKITGKEVVLKVFGSSQEAILRLLTEATNTKLAAEKRVGGIAVCYGISQEPKTKNYVMVMEYMSEGNLRECLQKQGKELKLWDKIRRLEDTIWGLNSIHEQNLTHQDLHMGNMLSSTGGRSIFITDLGLSQPVSETNQKNVYGVLPYVAPEVLQGQPYTQASDIYSFGIIAYELLANTHPYYEYEELKDLDDNSFASKIYEGLRPDIDKVPIPQLLKDLIKRCLDAEPKKRPSAEDLGKLFLHWTLGEVVREDKSKAQFHQQCQALESEYNAFSQNTPYKIHPNAVTHSKLLDINNTKQIINLLEKPQSIKKVSFLSDNKITEQIKEIENKLEEIKRPLDSKLAELVERFVEINKKWIKDKKDRKIRNEVRELNEKFKEENLIKEKIKDITLYCERLVKLERQLEQIQLQANVEITSYPTRLNRK